MTYVQIPEATKELLKILSKEEISGWGLLNGHTEPPAIRAAANQDGRKLLAIFELNKLNVDGNEHIIYKAFGPSIFEIIRGQESGQYSPNIIRNGVFEEGRFNSPVLQAILSGHEHNLSTCLTYGADPNGIDISCMDLYAAWFYRYRNYSGPKPIDGKSLWHGNKAMHGVPQLGPLIESELMRRRTAWTRFWTDQACQPLEIEQNGSAMPSLVAAAKVGSVEMFELVFDAGADASFWLEDALAKQLPQPHTISSLAVNTPLHAAIRAGHLDMAKHLLSKGFSANVLPLATPTQAVTPLMACMMANPLNHAILDLLLTQPSLSVVIKTPIFEVHILHFVAAKLDLHLFHLMVPMIPLANAGITAIGHNLLHVACLPLNTSQVNIFSEPAWHSIRESRDLDIDDPPARAPKPSPQRSEEDITKEDVFAKRHPVPTPEDARALVEVLQYLVASGTQDVRHTDMHGNTPLHYLAGHMHVNEAAIYVLRETDAGQGAWEEVRNNHGFTAKEIYEAGKVAIREPRKDFWGRNA